MASEAWLLLLTDRRNVFLSFLIPPFDDPDGDMPSISRLRAARETTSLVWVLTQSFIGAVEIG
jgi:hypothetical protein